MSTPVQKSPQCKQRVVKNRVRGIRRLSITGDKRFISAFKFAARSPCEKVRAAGVWALGKRWTWTPGRRALLFKMLRDPSYRVRAESARGLGKLGDPTVAPHLESLLKNDLSAVRRSTRPAGTHGRVLLARALIDSLEKLKGVDAVPVLLDAILDPDAYVFIVAYRALERIIARQPLPKWVLHRLVGLLHTESSVLVGELIGQMRGRREVVHKILPFLKHKSKHVRTGAIIALKGLKDRRIVDRIVPLAYDSSQYVRAAAVEMLGLTGDRSYVPLLCRSLKDTTTTSVRFSAVVALGRIGGIEAFMALDAVKTIRMNDTLIDERQEAVICYTKKALILNAVADLFINPLLSLLTFNLVNPIKVDPGRAGELMWKVFGVWVRNKLAKWQCMEPGCPPLPQFPPAVASCIPSNYTARFEL